VKIREQDKAYLFVMVGPGGTGKNTLMNIIKKRHPELKQLATATTRPPRANEAQGREHLFVSLEEFQRMIRDDELLEHQEVTPGKFYGIPRNSIEDQIYDGQHLIADIEVLGAKIVRETYPDDAVMIFVTVPSETPDGKLEVLRQRMLQRLESDPSEADLIRIQQRLDRARDLEFPFAEACDYVIINDDITRAVDELDKIITAKIQECIRS
jgi:guanylate kinase